VPHIGGFVTAYAASPVEEGVAVGRTAQGHLHSYSRHATKPPSGRLPLLAKKGVFFAKQICSPTIQHPTTQRLQQVITAKQTVIKNPDSKGDASEINVKFWNPTVANLTLLALGSSAPEILLAVFETVRGCYGAVSDYLRRMQPQRLTTYD
jgi:hypothetical protein